MVTIIGKNTSGVKGTLTAKTIDELLKVMVAKKVYWFSIESDNGTRINGTLPALCPKNSNKVKKEELSAL